MKDERIAGFFQRYDGHRVHPPGARCPTCNMILPRNEKDSVQHQYECAINQREMYGPQGRPDPRRVR